MSCETTLTLKHNRCLRRLYHDLGTLHDFELLPLSGAAIQTLDADRFEDGKKVVHAGEVSPRYRGNRVARRRSK